MITKLTKTTALASFLLAGASMPALAQADGSASDYPLILLNDCTVECGFPAFEDANEATAFLHDQFFNDGDGASSGGANGPSGLGLGLGLGLNAPQVVYLDFQPGGPTYPYTLFGIETAQCLPRGRCV